MLCKGYRALFFRGAATLRMYAKVRDYPRECRVRPGDPLDRPRRRNPDREHARVIHGNFSTVR